MSQTTPAEAPIRKRVRILLIVSLALNLAVVGLVGGVILRGGPSGGPPRSIDMAVGPLGTALSREDRRAIGQALRNDPVSRSLSREEFARVRAELATIVSAEPFDAAALSDAIEARREQLSAVQDAAAGLLVARIGAMTVEERQAIGDALRRNEGPGVRR